MACLSPRELRILSRQKGWAPGEEPGAAAPSTEGHAVTCDVTVPPRLGQMGFTPHPCHTLRRVTDSQVHFLTCKMRKKYHSYMRGYDEN